MSQLRPALLLLLMLTLITGGVYPLLTTWLAQWWFPQQAQGSLIYQHGIVRGSQLIGQNFTGAEYFQGRPSASGDAPYNPLASSGSNLAGSNPALEKAVAERIAALRAANPEASATVPTELVTASASGLDPEISPAAARWQAPRIARARQIALAEVQGLINDYTTTPFPAYLGEPVVNVLALNLALDNLTR